MADKNKVDYPDFEEPQDEYIPSIPSPSAGKAPLEGKRKVALVDDSDEDAFDEDKAKLLEMLRQAGTFFRGLGARIVPVVLVIGGFCLLPLIVLKGLVFRKRSNENTEDNTVTKNSRDGKRDAVTKPKSMAFDSFGKDAGKAGAGVETGGTVVVRGKKKPLTADFDDEDDAISRNRSPLRTALALSLVGALGGAALYAGIEFRGMTTGGVTASVEGEADDENPENAETVNNNGNDGGAVFAAPETAPLKAGNPSAGIPTPPAWDNPPGMPTTNAVAAPTVPEIPLPPVPSLWDAAEDAPSLPAFPVPEVPMPVVAEMDVPALPTAPLPDVPSLADEPLNNVVEEAGAFAESTADSGFASLAVNGNDTMNNVADNAVDSAAGARVIDEPELPGAGSPSFAHAVEPSPLSLDAVSGLDTPDTPGPVVPGPGFGDETASTLLTEPPSPAYAAQTSGSQPLGLPVSDLQTSLPNASDNRADNLGAVGGSAAVTAAGAVADAAENVKMVRIDTPDRTTPRVLTPSAPFDAEAVRAQTIPVEEAPMVSLATSLNENPPALPTDPAPTTRATTPSSTQAATQTTPLPFTSPQLPGHTSNASNAMAAPEPETTLPHTPLGLPLVGIPAAASTIQETGPMIPDDPNPVSVTDARATPAAASSAISSLAVSAPRETAPTVEGARFSDPAALPTTPEPATFGTSSFASDTLANTALSNTLPTPGASGMNLPLPTSIADGTQPAYAVAEANPRYGSAASATFRSLDTQQAASATLTATPYQGTGGTTNSLGQLPQQGQTYIVPQNETYWTIAEHAYGSGRYYRALAIHNRSTVSDPRDLQGKQIEIPTLEYLQTHYPDESPARRTPGAAADTAISSTTRYYSTASPSPVPSPAAVERPSLLNGALLPNNAAVSGAVSSAGRDPQGTGRGMIYIVQEGDDLFSIAKNKLGDISLYTKIYALNKDKIGADGRSLTPGTELVLPIDSQSSTTLLRRF